MTTYNMVEELKHAAQADNIEEFEKLLVSVETIPFELESYLFTNNRMPFVVLLYESGKLSDRSKVLFNGLLDKKTRIKLKLDKI